MKVHMLCHLYEISRKGNIPRDRKHASSCQRLEGTREEEEAA